MGTRLEAQSGAQQWIPKDDEGADTVPDAQVPFIHYVRSGLTTDLALRFDPIYGPISQRFLEIQTRSRMRSLGRGSA